MTTPAEPQAADEARKLAPATAAESGSPKADTASADPGEEKWDVKDLKARVDGRRGDRDIPEDGKGKWAQQGPKDRDGGRHGRHGSYHNGGNQRNYGNQRGRGNYRGNGNYHARKKRSDEFANLPKTSDPVKIAQQLRFYFYYRNICQDWHLFNLLGGPDNIPIPLKHLANFNRMKQFQPYSAIVDAVRGMDDFILVEDGHHAGPGNEAIKLTVPMVAPPPRPDANKPPTTEGLFMRMKDDVMNDTSASVYIKGFETGDDEPGQIELENEYRPFGSISVRKRLDGDANFKGSVFVDFESADAQKQFLSLDPQPKWKGKDLKIMGKREYVVAKCEEKGITPDWDRTEEERQEIRRERRKDNDEFKRSNGDHKRSYGGRGRGTPFGRRGNRHGSSSDRDRRGHERRDRDRRSPQQEQDPSDSAKEHHESMPKGETLKRKGEDLDGNTPKKPMVTIKDE